MRKLKYAQAVLEATDQMMEKDPSIYVMGLGVPDPKGTFGTTLGLAEKYGPQRVMDMPASENAMTGIGIGSAIAGMRPIMTHQRVDFFLLAFDQLVNNAAKWRYMFAQDQNVPIVFRLMIGRGWGQGPQHSQTLHSVFAHIPGLQVVMPAFPADAKGLLVSALKGQDPVVFMEHRWVHNTEGDVPEEVYEVPFGKARVVFEGSDVTLVAASYMVLEAKRAAEMLRDQWGVNVELIDVRSIKPLDKETIFQSVKKTGRLIVADPDWRSVGFASEVITLCMEELWGVLKQSPVRITYPDSFVSTSWKSAKRFYPNYLDMVSTVLDALGIKHDVHDHKEAFIGSDEPHDTPDQSFKGPF